ncbi:TIGR03086 family metal-binding protein [Jatrophihabitans sp. DSM 45814]
MSTGIAIYQRVVGHFTDLVDSVEGEQWAAPTPCEGWSVRDLLEHVVLRDQRIANTVGGPEVAALPDDVDLAAAWRDRVNWWAEGLADPARIGVEYETAMGTMTFEQLTVRFMTGELTVHTWDLARALGADEQLDTEAVSVAFANMRGASDMLRRPGVMGPELEVPSDADEQTRFIAFTGRRV